MMTIQDCRVGMKVFFGRPNGQKTLGQIVKIGRSKCKVRSLETRGYRETSGEIWNVPVTLMTPEDNGRPAQITKLVPALPDYSSLTPAQLLTKIRDAYCGLSPENLHCDGEAPLSYVRAKYAELQRELRACFKALGREVSESEAFRMSA